VLTGSLSLRFCSVPRVSGRRRGDSPARCIWPGWCVLCLLQTDRCGTSRS